MQSVLFSNYLHYLGNTFSFNGRVCRSEYWAFCFVHSFIIGPLVALGFMFFSSLAIFWNLQSFIMFIASLMSLFFLITSVSITIKRLHDFNASGFYIWLELLPIINLLLLVVCLFAPGNRHENNYGNPTSLNETNGLDHRIIVLVLVIHVIGSALLYWLYM